MVFNDTSNQHDSLVHYVNDILGVDNNKFSLTWKARSTNTAKYYTAIQIWKNQDMWKFDDTVNSGLPEASQNLSNGTQEYTLTTTAINIERVEVLDSGGISYKLQPFDESNIPNVGLPSLLTGGGAPQFYRLVKRSIFLYPAPATGSVTMTNGLKIYFNKEVNEFTAASTTAEVGIGEPGDRLVAYMVAEEYAKTRGIQTFPAIQQARGELEAKFMQNISHRTPDMKPRILPYLENYE